MKLNSNYKKITLLSALIICFTLSGCKKFVEVDDPIDQIPSDLVFNTDAKAASAVRGLYGEMVGSTAPIFTINYAFGGGVQLALGLSSDELNCNSGNANYEFFSNSIASNSGNNSNYLWGPMYNMIFNANSVIQNIATSTGMTEPAKKQFAAEAKFIRAANFFYLVNIYGDIPMPLTTDYKVNANLPRVPADQIYDLILDDLKYAQANIGTAYSGTQRLRANKYTISALLARVYLYRKDWANAELQASDVIDGSGSLYTMETDLSKNFLTSSKEVILQLQQPGTNLYTWDGYDFISTGVPNYQITDSLYAAFEPGDLRKTNWIKTNTITTAGVTKSYNFPFKYKLNSGTGTTRTESLVFLRLSEVYLIRAEARAQQNKLAAAVSDLDVVRKRAGITLIASTNPDITQVALLSAIAHERFVELFAELGHRWLDLKRTGKADEILKYKLNWRPEAKLFPIPLGDMNTNTALTQNPGYN
ncbi:MAG TPA: RagB/SusD family nutrient uptake outer membrane protein [Pedobacter sp.]